MNVQDPNRKLPATMLSDDDFRQILEKFDRPWQGYRKVRKGIKKRIRRHMAALAAGTVHDYLRLLEQEPREREICKECLLVTISRFFRDRNLWHHLRSRLLPELLALFPEGIRAWSVGCASGEEVYSLVILWQMLQTEVVLEILATDVQADNLERARHGVYERGSLKEVPPKILERFFFACSTGRRYSIRPQLKPPIQWYRHDLFAPPPDGGPFQLILLRNSLLTYHRGPAMTAAFSRIAATLAPGGGLIVGSHEQPPATSMVLERDPQCASVFRLPAADDAK